MKAAQGDTPRMLAASQQFVPLLESQLTHAKDKKFVDYLTSQPDRKIVAEQIEGWKKALNQYRTFLERNKKE